MAVNTKRQGEMKGKGFLLQKDKEHYSVRFLSRAGNYTTEELKNLNYLADKYGRGYIGITTRLQMEIPWIKDSDAEKLMEEAAKLGLRHGGTGKKVRPLVACKGTVCQHGNIDTQEICRQLEDKYFAKDVHSKCKFNIVGCANNCAKANINDIGIMGKTVPEYIDEKCVGCGLCVKACRQKALEVKDKKIVWNKELCVNCGCCVRACKTGGFITKEVGAEIFIGGRFGRGIRIGDNLGILVPEDKIVETVDKIMDAYKSLGEPNERISKTIERVGKETFIEEINL